MQANADTRGLHSHLNLRNSSLVYDPVSAMVNKNKQIEDQFLAIISANPNESKDLYRYG